MSYLHFWYWVESEDDCGYDYFWIDVNDDNVYSRDLCYEKNTGEWVQGVVNISTYVGKTVTLKFEAITDYSFISDIFLDDIFFSTTALISPGTLVSDGFAALDDINKNPYLKPIWVPKK